jgi:hypothetical protein
MPTLVCPTCEKPVDVHLANCPDCRAFVGYPNVRRAEGMRGDLEKNYTDALGNALARGTSDLVDRLERLLAGTVGTINVSPKMLDIMTLGVPYFSYHRALEMGLRRKAEDIYHSHRLGADAKVHPGYEKDIIYAALSPDGRGLTGYGEITLRLRDDAMTRRASLLRENAFAFYERYKLGDRDAQEAPGWRAVWADRAWLGVAHIEASLTPALSPGALPDLILHTGATRHDDRFIEVHIFDPLSWQMIASATLDRPITDAEARDEWDFARTRLARRGVPTMDHTVP